MALAGAGGMHVLPHMYRPSKTRSMPVANAQLTASRIQIRVPTMKISGLCVLLPVVLIGGCAKDGATAPPDKPVTQTQAGNMSPEQKAGYEQAMKSRQQAMAATHAGSKPPGAGGQ